jgi:hypothetical protein
MTEHTATPWRTNGKHIGPGIENGINPIAKAYDPDTVAFIVKACNLHEELTDAIKQIRRTIRMWQEKPGEMKQAEDVLYDVVDICNAIIPHELP